MRNDKYVKMTDKEIETGLESPGQQLVRKAVQSLPEESLSLEWRSRLNERLRVSAAPKALRVFARIWQPAVGLVGALSLAAVVTVRLMDSPVPQVATNSNLEAAFVSSHTEMSRLQDVTGAGLGMYELHETTRHYGDSDLWEDLAPGNL